MMDEWRGIYEGEEARANKGPSRDEISPRREIPCSCPELIGKGGGGISSHRLQSRKHIRLSDGVTYICQNSCFFSIPHPFKAGACV